MTYRKDIDTDERLPTGYHATSQVSAKQTGKKKNDYRQKIHSLIYRHAGLTCEQVEDCLSLSHQTASCIIRFLTQDGLLKDSGRRNTNRSGREAIVWVVNAPQMPLATQMPLIADPMRGIQ